MLMSGVEWDIRLCMRTTENMQTRSSRRMIRRGTYRVLMTRLREDEPLSWKRRRMWLDPNVSKWQAY